MIIQVEALERSDGRVVLFYGDRVIGVLDGLAVQDLSESRRGERTNGKPRKSRKPAKRRAKAKSRPRVKHVAARTVDEAEPPRGKNTGILRRCEQCGAKTKRTVCPNGHRVANDPEAD